MDMMVMGGNLPAWVSPVAWTYIILAALSAIAIVIDVFLGGHRQPSRAMEIVWPVTALYVGPFALWAYARWARPASTALSSPVQDDTRSATPLKLAFGLPGGAASVIAHFLGVPLVVLTGWTIAGLDMWAMIAVIAVIALVLLFSFEYSSRAAASARVGRGSSAGVRRAAVVAAVTIVAFDLGMVGWMVVLHLGSLMPPVDEASFVFLMQIGVVLGLATAYPVISSLARRANTA